MQQAAKTQFQQIFLGETQTFSKLPGVVRKAIRVSVSQRVLCFDAMSQGKHHGFCLFIDVALEPQKALDTAESIPQRGRRAPEIRRTRLACLRCLRRSWR